MSLSQKEIGQLNEWGAALSFLPTQQYRWLINSTHRYNCCFAGNQGGKTSGVARHYVTRINSFHPVPRRNPDFLVCENWGAMEDDRHLHEHAIIKHPGWTKGEEKCRTCGKPLFIYFNPVRIFRFASESLPMSTSGEGDEVKNTQYPELKKWLPPSLVKKDLTARNPVITVLDINGGPDMYVEFVSYNQSVQSTAGPQRLSIWLDEEAPPDFLEEQYPRLIAADGDLCFSLTAANKTTYMYDDFYEKAQVYKRTDEVVNFANEVMDQNYENIEHTTSDKDICVIQFASDDNPTLSKQSIDDLFRNIDDPNRLAVRRYGLFSQIAGRVFKGFDNKIHIIRRSDYKLLDNGIPPYEWVHARGIDYHEHVDWHYVGMALSPEDELFIWSSLRMSPGSYTSFEISQEINSRSGDIKFKFDRVDPLANKIQTNTGTTVMDDLNRYFRMFKREASGTGSNWKSWDTTSTRGREQIRLRLKNSVVCGKPFNNLQVTDRGRKFLPTIWILDNCQDVADYLRTWRYEEHKMRDAAATKDTEKETIQQKWSHYPMVIEAILKERSFKPMRHAYRTNTGEDMATQYFNRRHSG